MEKSILLTKLDEVLKDIHPSNLAFKRLAAKAIELTCAEPSKDKYEVFADKDDNEFFMRYDPWDSIGMFKGIFKKIGMNVTELGCGGGMGGERITFKIVT